MRGRLSIPRMRSRGKNVARPACSSLRMLEFGRLSIQSVPHGRRSLSRLLCLRRLHHLETSIVQRIAGRQHGRVMRPPVCERMESGTAVHVRLSRRGASKSHRLRYRPRPQPSSLCCWSGSGACHDWLFRSAVLDMEDLSHWAVGLVEDLAWGQLE